MASVVRIALKVLAVAMAAAPFMLAALLVFSSRTTSLVVVAPSGVWIFAAIFVAPVLLGVAIWRLATLIR